MELEQCVLSGAPLIRHGEGFSLEISRTSPFSLEHLNMVQGHQMGWELATWSGSVAAVLGISKHHFLRHSTGGVCQCPWHSYWVKELEFRPVPLWGQGQTSSCLRHVAYQFQTRLLQPLLPTYLFCFFLIVYCDIALPFDGWSSCQDRVCAGTHSSYLWWVSWSLSACQGSEVTVQDSFSCRFFYLAPK